MPKVIVDGQQIEVKAGLTVLQACEIAGKEIPRFCYHERLAIAGNCRMCLVAIEKMPKPVASCAMPVAEGMVVHTDTPAVQRMRKSVMEFLLINHPLDCPICDQGGECDLQDQVMGYGFDRSRYREEKRAVAEKFMGPLIKTHMTRCIHCTRCIRFMTDVAGVPELGATGRGEHMQVTTYVEQALTSELSANIVDLCPVGALTSAPYAFVARPWELRKTDTVDVLDALGSAIRVDARGPEVLRVLPRINDVVNEEWISDKTRYAIDGLTRQRLDRPYVRRDGRLRPASWAEALDAVAARLTAAGGARTAAIAGDLACAESMVALKDLMDALGSPHVDCRQDGAKLPAGPRAAYLFNSTVAGIENADALLLVGANPRAESPVLNARIRKRFLKGSFLIAAVGPAADLSYAHADLGDRPAVLDDILAGRHPFAETLRNAKRPMIVVGQGALKRADGATILGRARTIAEAFGMVGRDPAWNGFNVLHTAAARVGGLDLGLVPRPGGRDVAGILAGAESGEIDAVYLLGADEIDMRRLGRAFVVYQGHHGDAGAHRADVVLPGAAYTEKSATYVNTEGRAQRAWRAVQPPGEAREDWAILRALSQRLGRTLPYDTLDEVRARLVDAGAGFAAPDGVSAAPWGAFGTMGPLLDEALAYPIANFYMTDPISRASLTMARCTETFVTGPARRTGTHG